MSVFEKAISLLSPTACLACAAEGPVLCQICRAVEIIDYGEHCWRCGAAAYGARTCPKCRHLGGPRHVWLSTHYEGAAAELVKTYKFTQTRAAADSLVEMMAETFGRYAPVAAKEYLVVPIPTATRRIRQRGFDHGGLLATKLARRLGYQKLLALGRLGQTRQLGALRAQRLTQLSGQFWLQKPAAVIGQNILLIDDVLTTGATLAEAARTLRAGGAKRVDALVFAKRL